MKKLIIFDLDGTLLNTIEDLGNAVNHALGMRGLPLHKMEEYPSMVGHGVRNLMAKALPEGHGELVDECLSDFREYYMEHIDSCTRPYPGMTELVHQLREEGCLLAIASNKFQAGTSKLISSFFPDIDWVAVCGNCDKYALKPDPTLIEEIKDLAVKSLQPGETISSVIMVGDSDTDMKTAINAGIPSIAVTWGFRSREELARAEAKNFAGTASEVHELIQSL